MARPGSSLVLPLLALLSALPGCSAPEPEPWARATVIEDLSQTIGGPKALVQPGDFLLENDRIRLGILGKRYSMSSGLFGGALVDADLQRYDPSYGNGQGNDCFNELFPTISMNVMAAGPATSEFEVDDTGLLGAASTVEVLQEGSETEPAIIRVTAPSAPFISILDALWAILGMPTLQYVTDYILEPGQPWVRIRTTVTMGDGVEPVAEATPIPPATPEMPLLDYAIESGIIMGDFFLAGGSVDVFAPGIGFDESGAVFDAMSAGRNLFLDPFVVDWLAAEGDGTSYGLAPVDGALLIPMFTSDQTAAVGGGVGGSTEGDRFPDGTAYTYERIFSVGEGDVGSALDGLLAARGIPTGSVEGHVLDSVTRESISGVSVMAFRGAGDTMEPHAWSAWTSDVGQDHVPDGSFGGTLPEGTWTLTPYLKGHPEGPSVEVEVTAGQTTSAWLELPRAGEVEITVVDEENREVPAKITFYHASGETLRRPEYGDSYIAGGATDVVFTPGGPLSTSLPPGEYTAVASRGPEYEIAWSDPFTVSDHGPVQMRLQVVRSVDTTGWIAADFHVHSDSSFDSGLSKERRLTSMAAEGMEFFFSTDHDFLTDYAPTLQELGLEPWIRTGTGVEISTLELGHYLCFPVEQDFLAPSGGAFDWTDMTPSDMFEACRALGAPDGVEPILLVAHPRDGILGYFDQFGVNAYVADGDWMKLDWSYMSLQNPLLVAENFDASFEGMEIFNAKRFELIRSPTQDELDRYAADGSVTGYDVVVRTPEEQQALIDGTYTLGDGVKGQVDDWFNLLNLGYRYTAVGNSDTHDVTTNESGVCRNYLLLDTDDPATVDPVAVVDALRAHRVVTTYGPFVHFEADGQPVGSDVTANGPVELTIEVQSPTWYDVDHVELYENGTLLQAWDVAPGGTVLDFSEVVAVEPTTDAWYVVIVASDDTMEPVATPVDRPYVQLQDVVTEALSPIESVGSLLGESTPRPRTFPILPYAVTNPIWVDVDGDGWTAPGLPAWLSEPVTE